MKRIILTALVLVLSGCSQHSSQDYYSNYFYVTSTYYGYVCRINETDVTDHHLSLTDATRICATLNKDIAGNEDIREHDLGSY